MAPESVNEPQHEAVDASTLRRTMGRFATGVAVITTGTNAEPHGMTVNSLTSISLDPPLVLVSLTEGARSTEAVRATGSFVINVLSVRQEQLAKRFARQGEDHFEGLPLEYEHHEIPVVPAALAHVECVTESEISAGDHIIFLGRVRRTCDRDGQPLAFYSGQFGEFTGHGHGEEYWFY